jgi:hypothetical protein
MSNKYRAVKVKADGLTFDSKAEHRRYCELKLLQAAGEISTLSIHEPFPCHVAGQLICTYEADFVYWAKGASSATVEDVKGVKTAVYRLKKKLVKAIYGIEITEVKA